MRAVLASSGLPRPLLRSLGRRRGRGASALAAFAPTSRGRDAAHLQATSTSVSNPIPASLQTLAVGSSSARSSSSVAASSVSALRQSTQKFRQTFWDAEAKLEIAKEADAPVDQAAAIARLRSELTGPSEALEVMLNGEALSLESAGRRIVKVETPTGPGGGPAVRSVDVPLPTVEEIRSCLQTRRETPPRAEKPEEIADVLEQFLKDKYYGKRSDHVGLIAAWGPKVLGDAEGEYAEVGALMALSLGAYRGALKASKDDFQFEVSRVGNGRECLVMPPSNFALLGLKDLFHVLLQGFRVFAVVQPRFFAHYREMQKDLYECGLPEGLFEVVPGITPEADPEVLHEVLKAVDRLQFTGSSLMYVGLVKKAYELGNLRMEHGGEVSGLNKVRLDGVSASHPAAAAGSAWAAMANNGELCTSASLLEFDPATGDTPDSVKAALEAHSFKLGGDPEDGSLNVLLKSGKSKNLEVLTEEPASGFQEWWEKQILVQPRGDTTKVATNHSLGHCIYAPSIERAVSAGVKEDASCIYCVGVPEDAAAPSARAGTTGCKLPESVFGGMKSYTFAVAGDHDGVGSLQTLLGTVKRRGANYRDQEESHAQYEMTETAEDLLTFLGPRDQATFPKQLASVLEVYAALEPQVTAPYGGQPLVGGEGSSQLVTLTATRPARKSLLIPRGVGLPEEIVKVALLCEMSPLKEVPVDLHLLEAGKTGKLRVTDPVKSFLRVVEKRLGWRIHWHEDADALAAAMQAAEYPPYFFCTKDRHMLPLPFLMAVADKGGYLYEGMPADALSIYRMMTTTQAWTVACTEAQVAEAQSVLQKAWQEHGLREEAHPDPEVVMPSRRSEMDIGGGFGAAGPGFGAGDNFDDISDDSSSDDEPEVVKKPAATDSKAADAKSTDPATDKAAP